jgi:predicted regulator of amino acid metabolism with ACT domain
MDNSAAKVHRVKISEQDWATLEHLTKKYGCTYDGKLSISGLLSQIAEGRLKLTAPAAKENLNVQLIQLDIEVLSNLNGTLAAITKIIAKHNCNIYRAMAVENSVNSHVRMEIYVPPELPLSELFNSLNKIIINDIFDFNEDAKLENLLKVIDEDQYRRYLKSKTKAVIRDWFEEIIDYKSIKIVKAITVGIGFQLVTKNQKGTLHELTDKIAQKRASISDIKITYDQKENKSFIYLLLSFSEIGDDLFKRIASIQKFMSDLKEPASILEVNQLDLGHFI